MAGQKEHCLSWRAFPILSLVVSEWRAWSEERMKPSYSLASLSQDNSDLSPYPLDMWPLLALPLGTLDEDGVPYNRSTSKYPATYHPTTIAQYALAHWNAYLTARDEKHKQAFIIQARWLVEHEEHFTDDMGGWPIPFPAPDFCAPAKWLSAMTQGEGISVMVRAYQLTGETTFLSVAQRAVLTFKRDIREGGVTATIGDDGIFFEEVAVYPAAHILNGFLFALFGLYDYVALTSDPEIEQLIQRSLVTLHLLLDKFDTGYWSRYELLFRHIAPLSYHKLHVLQLRALIRYTGCEHCAVLAARWEDYLCSRRSRMYYLFTYRIARYRRGLRRVLLGASELVFPRKPLADQVF